MGTFMMFGEYSYDSVKEISPDRTRMATELIQRAGGQLKYVYVLLGETDLLLITDFPTIQQAMRASIDLSKLLGVVFKTSPAIGAEEFDQLVDF